MTTLRLSACIGAILTNGALMGCLGDLKVAPSGSGGAGGAGGTGGAGAGGETMICSPGMTSPCNTGQFGICAEGIATCDADGMNFGPCQITNTPVFDDCTTAEDDDCDGTPISQCTGTVDWTTTRTGANAAPMDDSVFGIAVTSGGEYVITGVVDGSIDSGVNVNSGKFYLAKFDATGIKQWERSLAATLLVAGHDVAVDSQGNIIVVGEYRGNFIFDNSSFASNNNSRDIFVAKFDSAGKTLWAKSYGTGSNDLGKAVVVDSSDNIIFTGWARGGTINFGTGNMSVSADDACLVKLAPDGTALWSKVFLNGSDQHGQALALAPNGDIVLGGESNGDFSLGGSPHTVTDGYDAFLGRFAGADGAFLWSRVFVGSADQFTRGVTMAKNGNPILLGRFAMGIDFGGGNVFTTMGGSTGFLAEFDAATGIHVQSRAFGTTGTTFPLGIAVDQAGHVYIAGSFGGTIDFGMTSIPSTVGLDEFTVKLEATTWSPLWLRATGNAGDQNGTALTVDGQGRAIVGGSFATELVGPTSTDTLLTTGGLDLFVQRLQP